MQQSVALFFVLLVAVALAGAARIRRDEKYTTKYDSINVDEILESDRLRNNYVSCVLEKGKCTPEGTELRSHVKDALQTECSKCSEKQKEQAEKVLRYLYTKQPEQWKLLQEKYDPDNTYAAKYKDVLEGKRSLVSN